MTTICLVACAATKGQFRCQAKDLYVSPLFKKTRAYVERRAWQWYILSAKHYLLEPGRVIEPYELTLKTMRSAERKLWAREVTAQLERVLRWGDTVVFLAGGDYRELLSAEIERICGTKPQAPTEGLRIGEQMRWLQRCINRGEN